MSTAQRPGTRLRVVVDTNVIVSALNFSGNEFQILELVRQGRIDVYLSSFILAEVERVLENKFAWPAADVRSALTILRRWATVVDPRMTVTAVRRDDADNRILECCVEGHVDYLVTGDRRDLIPLQEFQGVKILSPAQFLAIINSQ